MKMSNKNKAKALVAYYADSTNTRSKQVVKIIEEAEGLKIEFPNRTKLSEYVALRLGQLEGSPVAASTIRRNENYNAHLVNYFLRVSPEKLGNKFDKAIDASLAARELRNQLKEKDQQIAQLTDELCQAERLLEKRLQLEYAEKYSAHTSRGEQIKSANEETDESLFELLYSALSALGSVEFNADEGVVLDEAEEKVLMTRSQFPKFFKWLTKKV